MWPFLTPFQHCRIDVLRLRRHDGPLSVPKLDSIEIETGSRHAGQNRNGEISRKDRADHIISVVVQDFVGSPVPRVKDSEL